MRIGIDGRDLFRDEVTGIGRFVLNFLNGVKVEAGDHEYVVFLNEKNYCDTEGHSIKKIVIKGGSTFQWDQFLLPACLNKERIDIFFSPYFKAPLSARCKVITSILDIIPFMMEPYKSSLKTKLNNIAIRIFSLKASRIITISYYSKREIMEYLKIPSEKIEVIYPGVGKDFMPIKDYENISQIKRYFGISGNYILYIGNLKPHKNLLKLIESYSLLPSDIRNEYQLIIGGKKDKNYDSLSKEVNKRGIKERVIFTDFIRDEDLPALYSGASLFVFLSLYEGFGLPVLEAMACGVPVIVSNSTSIPEITEDAAILVDPEDTGDIVKAISNILEDVALRNEMIPKGFERARLFSREGTVKRMIKLFEEI